MNKKIVIDSNRFLQLDISSDYSYSIIITETFFNENNIEKEYTLSRSDDYNFYVSLDDYDNINEVSFSFDIDHPLYFSLLHLLRGSNSLIIDDDDTFEVDEKYLEIRNDDDIIKLSFHNKMVEETLFDYDKFNIFIKNICFDGRSKIDQQYKDTKDMLTAFFNEVVQILTEEYHQTTIEEYIVKQKVLKKQ
ncbi:MAG: hypothetical protein IKO49_07685 [Bacilli bacterium]|nr:hypothetical protein [Bacilli bacterium]